MISRARGNPGVVVILRNLGILQIDTKWNNNGADQKARMGMLIGLFSCLQTAKR